MPAGTVKSLAEQYGVSPETVEKYWRQCESAIQPVQNPSMKKGSRPGYGVVTNCVKAKLRDHRKKGAIKAVAKKLG